MNQLQTLAQTSLQEYQPQFDVELAPLTYMKIGGPAEIFVDATSDQAVVAAANFARQQAVPLTVLAGASNVIIDSQGLKGVVLRMATEKYLKLPETVEGKTLVRGSAGYRTGLFIRKTLDDGLTGLEYFMGVPGRIGGAIYNNAHYLSDLIGAHVHRVEVLSVDGQRLWMSRDECQFAYDYSIFHRTKDILLNIEFALVPGDAETSKALVREATVYRANTQPLGDPSSGCYFRNAENTDQLREMFPQFADRRELPAGFLIDQAGLKNTEVGGVKVSDIHAAFFINTGAGTSQNVAKLAELVQKTVLEKFGVALQPEVFTIST